MNPWKPIETAPKDGTPILVGCWLAGCSWNPITKQFEIGEATSEWHTTVLVWRLNAWFLSECDAYDDWGMPSLEMTHWTEIPTPPQQPQ